MAETGGYESWVKNVLRWYVGSRVDGGVHGDGDADVFGPGVGRDPLVGRGTVHDLHPEHHLAYLAHIERHGMHELQVPEMGPLCEVLVVLVPFV